MYNLEDRKTDNRFTSFEVYWYGADRKYFELERYFTINAYGAYMFSKTLGDKQDDFMRELQDLRDSMYDFVYEESAHGRLKTLMKKESDYKERVQELKKIYDFFLPKLKEFARKYDLGVNCD